MNDDLSDQSKKRRDQGHSSRSHVEVHDIDNSKPCQETNEDGHSKSHICRREFRKQKKLQRRQLYRKAAASERDRRKEKRRAQEEASHDQYLEQRNTWLAKEAMFDKISAAKRKAREIEAKAAQEMKASVAQAIASVPISHKPPVYIAPQKEIQRKTPNIPNMPIFIRREDPSTDDRSQ